MKKIDNFVRIYRALCLLEDNFPEAKFYLKALDNTDYTIFNNSDLFKQCQMFIRSCWDGARTN
jgi:hypothetical protein